jgi:hypothetical protein
MCGFLAKKQWKPVAMIYATMLGGFFLHPLGRQLPLWRIIDILIALILVHPATRISRSIFETNTECLTIPLATISFVGQLQTD